MAEEGSVDGCVDGVDASVPRSAERVEKRKQLQESAFVLRVRCQGRPRAAFVKHTLCTAVQHALVLPSSAPARRYPVSWRTCAGISPTVYVRSAHLFFCLRPSACLFVCLSRHNACAVCACVRALMRGWVCCAVFTRKCLANPEAFACLANQAPC